MISFLLHILLTNSVLKVAPEKLQKKIFLLFVLSFFVFSRYIPESIRWLRVKGRTEDVKSIINRMARTNKKKLDELEIKEFQQEKSHGLSYLLDLFRPRKLAVQSLIHGYAWYVNERSVSTLNWQLRSPFPCL